MNFWRFSLLLFCFSTATFGFNAPSSLDTALQTQLEKNAQRFGVVGQSILILKDHQPIFRGVQGYANLELGVAVDYEHVFPSYSVTKLLTSVLIMQLVEDEKINKNESIRSYLEHLPIAWQNVTIEHLLNHTSGIPRYFDAVIESGEFLNDKNAVYASLEGKPAHFPIGSVNRYNNTNFLLLASLLEKQTGMSYLQLVEQNIIQPLRLKNTRHSSAKAVNTNLVSSYQGAKGVLQKNEDIDWPEYSFSHSGLNSTPEDLAAFMSALFMGKLVKPETLSELLVPMKLNDGQSGSYAFGFEYSEEDEYIRVGHDGGNRVKLRHYVSRHDSAKSYTLVYMTNGNAHGVWTDLLADSVMSLVAPDTFKTAAVKDQFIEAGLDNNLLAMNRLYNKVKELYGGDLEAVERFLMYRAYAVQYASGIESAMIVFEFWNEKFPDSQRAQRGLNQARKAVMETQIN